MRWLLLVVAGLREVEVCKHWLAKGARLGQESKLDELLTKARPWCVVSLLWLVMVMSCASLGLPRCKARKVVYQG
ncbi:hypothetical protein TIFTF001_052464 [Ficus carica]|uniref:Uncharacterized protein n=1 Tax=Ficus carica TaxID=3494 RepID=A0AA88EGZ2_FICCA|nr:hypothetical protein TIFTF001_052464 [Ficus carica]